MEMQTVALLILSIWLRTLHSEYIPPGPKYSCPQEAKAVLMHPCICEKGSDRGLFIRCENTGLATLSVGIGNIAGLGLPIDTLVLKECQICRLYGPLLIRSSVVVLRIEDTPLASIEADAFVGVNNTLEELYIVNSHLKAFPKHALKILGHLSVLYLDTHNISVLDKDIFDSSLAAGRVERLHIINGNLSVLPVEPFQLLNKLKTLDLHGNQIARLQKHQFKGLRDTEMLDLSHNKIRNLDSLHLLGLTKMGWCNVSHNRIEEITRGVFARNGLLKVLHLNGNRLKSLDTHSFIGMRFLRRLYLQDNQISDVGRGTFATINRIGTIDLARNFITTVDYQMFYQLNFIEIIDLSENQITLIEKQAFKDVYKTWINISHNQLSDIEEGSFENCGDMILDLSHNKLEDIPRGAFDINTFAVKFLLSYNSFTQLDQVPLQNMTGLKLLNVSHNNIHTIPKGTFPKLYELYTVDLSHNKLKEIASSVFQPLYSLRFLNLSHNSMEQVRAGTLGTLPTVLQVDLSHNMLRDVSRFAMSQLGSCAWLDVSHNHLEKIFQVPVSLGELDFSHNTLSEVKANTWPSMNALLRLNLSHNRLEDNLNAESFVGLLTVLSLDLSSNGLTKPPSAALSKLSSLQYLIMRGNAITILKKSAFGRLPVVFQLDLASNRIVNVEQRAFDGLLQLLELSLSNNALEIIPNEAFKGLVSLRKLDLSHNRLEKIDNRTNGILDDCLSLEKVDLSHNYFSFITRKMFPNDPYIHYKIVDIDLSYNHMPVLTLDITYGTKLVKRLDLSHNNINEIRGGVLVNLPMLEHLDISSNSLTDLSTQTAETVFELPANIRTLNMAGNKLSTLPADQLAGAANLSELDVRNNKLTSFPLALVQRLPKSLRVQFAGNPIKCDCLMRPLKHYLNHLPRSQLTRDPAYAELRCSEPTSLHNQPLGQVDEDMLLCQEAAKERPEVVADEKGETFYFVEEPDVVFRTVKFSKTEIYLQWFTRSSEDVADFLVIIRDRNNEVYFVNNVPYTLRALTIAVEPNSTLKRALSEKDPANPLELCIQAKQADGYARKWFKSQCRSLAQDSGTWVPAPTWQLLKKSKGDERKGLPAEKRTWSGTLMLVSDSILITLCIFLGACVRKLSDYER